MSLIELNTVTFAVLPRPCTELEEQIDLAWRRWQAANDEQRTRFEGEYWRLRAQRGAAA